MFKVNENQYLEGRDFYHRVAWSNFDPDDCDEYSQLGGHRIDYNDNGRDAVVMSSHIYYGLLPKFKEVK